MIDQSIDHFGSEPNPGLAESLMHRGDVLWHLEREGEAQAAWQKASNTLDACGCKPEHLLSKLAQRIGQGDPEVDKPVTKKNDRNLAVVGIFTSTYNKMVNLIGGGIMPSKGFRDYVFFDNGESYKGMGTSLSVLKSPCTKKIHPNRWGTWSQDGEDYFVTKQNGKREKISWQQMPAPRDYTPIIGKTYHAESVTTAGGVFDNGVAVVGSRSITFLDEKTYTVGRFVGVTGDGITAYRNKNPSEFGTYELDEFTMRLTPDNGEKHEKLFYFGRESDDTIDYGLLSIGGTDYLLRD